MTSGDWHDKIPRLAKPCAGIRIYAPGWMHRIIDAIAEAPVLEFARLSVAERVLYFVEVANRRRLSPIILERT